MWFLLNKNIRRVITRLALSIACRILQDAQIQKFDIYITKFLFSLMIKFAIYLPTFPMWKLIFFLFFLLTSTQEFGFHFSMAMGNFFSQYLQIPTKFFQNPNKIFEFFLNSLSFCRILLKFLDIFHHFTVVSMKLNVKRILFKNISSEFI